MVKRFLLSLLLLASSVWAQAQNVPPTVSMFTSSVIGIAGTTITLNANASDQDGQIAKVDFYNGTTLLGTVTQKQPPCTTYCFAWPNVQAGVYNLTAVATDNLGASTTSAAFTTMVFAPPTVAIATPANNASYAAPASITFTANAADADGRVTKVEYLNGTTVIGTATAAPYSVTWSNVAVGSYVITARATDNTGIKTTSATVNVTVSANQAPTVTLEANPASTPAPGNVMLSANATDSDGTIAKVEFYNGTTLLSTLTQPPFAYNWLNIPAGTYTVTAKATDNGGMETVSTAVTVTVAAGPAQAYYIHADHVNTPRLITDQAGNKVWEWDNADPFGANAANEDPGNTGTRFTFNPRFPGQYFDRETGLYYNYFRDYDPATGRYVQSDPIGLKGGLNTYAYVEGNPLSLTDPEGLRGIMPGGRIWEPPVYDDDISCKPLFPQPQIDDNGCAKLSSGLSFCPSPLSTSRNKNKVRPVTDADGPHSVYKRGADGKTSNYATYEPNPRNPSGFQETKRVDVTGRPHRNPDGTVVPTPHVSQAGTSGVRPALPSELPR